MRIFLKHLLLNTKKTTEKVDFSARVTFIHGPVSTGKSTIARLIDYCLGGDLERTPAIQNEFLSATLHLVLGEHECAIERSADDTQAARVTWIGPDGKTESVNAPFASQEQKLIDADVYNLSDLIFYLCGVTPIKVRKRSRDPQSPLIRLSIRDIWFYCYLDQLHLDSSFFRLEDPFRGRKSQDAMRFFTGLHSERLSQLEGRLMAAVDEQRAKREAVQQIRAFMNRFELGSEAELFSQLEITTKELLLAEQNILVIDEARASQTHPTDGLRVELRRLGSEVDELKTSVSEAVEFVLEQRALRAELITAKTKASRVLSAGNILGGVTYKRCPQCNSEISTRVPLEHHCSLCCSELNDTQIVSSIEEEALRRDLNDRIDQLGDSLKRREREIARLNRLLSSLEEEKSRLDRTLQKELARYDSAYVETLRGLEREKARLEERLISLKRLQEMPNAISDIEVQAGELQGKIDSLRSSLDQERGRLRNADENVIAIADEFKRIMLAVHFPGVSESDRVELDPRDWKPVVVHHDQSWGFWDAGSGGKKTLFNVCYALAVHSVALDKGLPVPSLLIIDSPTKNISEDENPELIKALYSEIFALVSKGRIGDLQFLLIDSDLVAPDWTSGFIDRRIAGELSAPSLISYYVGP